MSDITLGQYYPAESPVHHLDPRAKILLLIAFIVGVFTATTLLAMVPVLLYILMVARLSHIPFKMLLKSIKPLRIILIFTFVLNIFFLEGETPIFDWWIIHLTKEGILNAVLYSIRLVLLVMGSSLLTLTTAPVVLTDGLERLLSPLKVIHFPAHELAMMMTIALRFIPTLLEETDKIRNAQMARGTDFETGNLINRAKAMIPLLVPLFVSAFRRAGDLAMAMEARCYHGGEGRTRLRVLRFTLADLWAALITLALVAVCVLLSTIPLF